MEKLKQIPAAPKRLICFLLALICMLGLLPNTAFAAGPNTIVMEDCTHNGVYYESAALSTCWLHQMKFDFNGDTVMGFCADHGGGMGWSLEGHEWNNPREITDPTVKTMMAYFYAHSRGIFTDQAKALGVDETWSSDYTWTMNAWVQAVVWRYQENLFSDPVAACAEELMYVYMVLLFAILFYRVNRQREMESEIAQLKQEQAEIVERDYQALRRTYEGNAKLYHDLHNHIEAIYQCLLQGDTEEAARYCEDLRTPVREISQTVWTGDKALDYLISSKLALAEQEHIKTKVNIEYPHNTNIRSVDLTTILGNLLDNALEAAQAAPDGLRFLNLTIRRINAMLIIKVENGYGHDLKREDGKLLTTKSDKAFHGWGLKSVQTAADRYDGTISTDDKDGIFQSVVTLSFQAIKTK